MAFSLSTSSNSGFRPSVRCLRVLTTERRYRAIPTASAAPRLACSRAKWRTTGASRAACSRFVSMAGAVRPPAALTGRGGERDAGAAQRAAIGPPEGWHLPRSATRRVACRMAARAPGDPGHAIQPGRSIGEPRSDRANGCRCAARLASDRRSAGDPRLPPACRRGGEISAFTERPAGSTRAGDARVRTQSRRISTHAARDYEIGSRMTVSTLAWKCCRGRIRCPT